MQGKRRRYVKDSRVEMTQLVLPNDTNQLTGKRKLTNSAFLTFVAMDERDKPVKVEEIIPQTKEERDRFSNALLRRKQRLTQNKYI